MSLGLIERRGAGVYICIFFILPPPRVPGGGQKNEVLVGKIYVDLFLRRKKNELKGKDVE